MTNPSSRKQEIFGVVDDNFRDVLQLGDPFVSTYPVVVPRAERFAVHKVIVAVERLYTAKSDKVTAQADALIQVLAKKRPIELAEAWKTAWDTGERWRDKLEKGGAKLSDEAQEALEEVGRLFQDNPNGKCRTATCRAPN